MKKLRDEKIFGKNSIGLERLIVCLLAFIFIFSNSNVYCSSNSSYSYNISKNTDKNEILAKLNKIDVDVSVINNIRKYINNPLGWSALNYAINEMDYKSASVIAEYSIDINKKDSLYTFKESHVKYNALSRLLYKPRFHTKVGTQSVLTEEQIALAHKLINRGIECDEIDSSQLTPICYCVYFGEIGLVSKLLEKGANINFAWENGTEIVLSTAVAKGHIDLVHYLISKGANVKLVGCDSFLHNAILSQKKQLVKLAIACGCEIKSEDVVKYAIPYVWCEVRNLGEDPSYRYPAIEMLRFILNLGGDPNFWLIEHFDMNQKLKDSFRYSPLGITDHLLDGIQKITPQQTTYQQELRKLLLDYGAFELSEVKNNF